MSGSEPTLGLSIDFACHERVRTAFGVAANAVALRSSRMDAILIRMPIAGKGQFELAVAHGLSVIAGVRSWLGPLPRAPFFSMRHVAVVCLCRLVGMLVDDHSRRGGMSDSVDVYGSRWPQDRRFSTGPSSGCPSAGCQQPANLPVWPTPKTDRTHRTRFAFGGHIAPNWPQDAEHRRFEFVGFDDIRRLGVFKKPAWLLNSRRPRRPRRLRRLFTPT